MKNNPFLPALLAIAVGAARLAAQSGEPIAHVSVDWNQRVSAAAVPTLQVVVNPLLRPGSPIEQTVVAELRSVNAEAVRFVPWYPYPKLAVAELTPPNRNRTNWDFSLIDPMVDAFMTAQAGRSVMMNFSTIPAWMFASPTPKTYSDDPDQTSWTYGGSYEPDDLRDPTLRELGDYYARLVSWYTRGYFIDELGRRHDSGHHFNFDYWEVLNEPDIEHANRQTDASRFDIQTAERYTRRYDAIVSAIKRVAPATKFVGAAIAYTSKQAAFFNYFLDPKNHRPGVPLDLLSFHFYAKPPDKLSPRETCDLVFAQADGFLDSVGYLELLRRRLSPATKMAANELGIILPGDARQLFAPKGADVSYPIPADYWNMAGALYAYLYARLSVLGVTIASESQLVGYPTQFPSVSMVDWNSGRGNARLQVLKLLVRNFPAGTHTVQTSVMIPQAHYQPDAVSALGLITAAGERRLLLVNKKYESVDVALELGAATVERIDRLTGAEIRTDAYPSLDRLTLQGFCVAVVSLGQAQADGLAPDHRSGLQ